MATILSKVHSLFIFCPFHLLCFFPELGKLAQDPKSKTIWTIIPARCWPTKPTRFLDHTCSPNFRSNRGHWQDPIERSWTRLWPKNPIRFVDQI